MLPSSHANKQQARKRRMVFIELLLSIAHLLLHPVLRQDAKAKDQSSCFTSRRSIRSCSYTPYDKSHHRGNKRHHHNTPLRLPCFHYLCQRPSKFQCLPSSRYQKALQRPYAFRCPAFRYHAHHRSLNRTKIRNCYRKNFQNCYPTNYPTSYSIQKKTRSTNFRCYNRHHHDTLHRLTMTS